MVAAGQAGDIDCLAAAMARLLEPEGHEAAMLPALACAEALRERNLMLMPVPRLVVEEMPTVRSWRACTEARPRPASGSPARANLPKL